MFEMFKSDGGGLFLHGFVVDFFEGFDHDYVVLYGGFQAVDATESAVEEFIAIPSVALGCHGDDAMRTDVIAFAVLGEGPEIPHGITSFPVVVVGSQLTEQRRRAVCLQEIVILEGTGVIHIDDKIHDECLLFRVRLRGSLAA